MWIFSFVENTSLLPPKTIGFKGRAHLHQAKNFFDVCRLLFDLFRFRSCLVWIDYNEGKPAS